MDCKFVRDHLDAYVDSELEPTPVIEFERHLDICGPCRNELSLARLVQRSVRELPAEKAPEALKLRVMRALDSVPVETHTAFMSSRGAFAPLLAAAGMALIGVGAAVKSDRGDAGKAPPVATADVGLLGDVVARHTDQLPAEIAADKPEEVTSWFRGKVGFRVRSVEFNEPQVRFLGARVSHIGDRQAAKLYYSVGDSRLTSVVFQPPPSLQQVLHDDRMVGRLGAQRQRIGSRFVTYQNVQGYTVPIIEHDGIAYAFTGDLDQQRLLQLVASARVP
jgi:anti-sigma factor (TIGR02949 family)